MKTKNRIDELGNKYGKLKVVEYVGTMGNLHGVWKCQCDCGNIRYYKGYDLRKGKVVSCGCEKKTRKSNFKDLTGKRHGRLIPIKYDENKKKWLCKCDCGNEIYANASDITYYGHTKSCGCLDKERRPYMEIRKQDKRFDRLESIHKHMIERCYRVKNDNYKNYGGRGIKVCDEWLDKKNGLMNFYNWAINNGYKYIDGELKDQMSIDRIDSDGNYEPSNCRWVTFSQNASNVSEVNKKLDIGIDKIIVKKNKKRKSKLHKFFTKKLLKKIKKFLTRKKKNENHYYYRKPNYCLLHNKDYTQQYLFKNYTTIAEFLDLTINAVSYRVRNKNGVLTDDWKIEKIDKETFDEIKNKGIEVIK